MTSSNLASRAHFLLLVVVLVVYSPSSSKFLAKVRPILLFQLLAKLKAVRWNLNIECRGCVSVAVREISLGICGEIFIKGNCLFGLFEWFYSATFYAYGTFLVEFQLSVLCTMRSWSELFRILSLSQAWNFQILCEIQIFESKTFNFQ